MSYNGSGTFQINTTGQPVVTGTVISSTAFNALTADLATGLSTAITKDCQTATTARIPFAQGITSTLVTDSSSTSTGSIITAGGIGVAKAAYIGTTLNVASTTTLTGVATLTANPVLSAGTANGVTYLNGSKSLTSGSALAFDGTNFSTTGTASASKLIPTGSSVTGNGLYLPAANALGLSTNGTNAVYIDASQNVGIGTSSPSYKLEVKGSSATAGQLSIHDGTGDTTVSGNNAASLLFQARDTGIRTIAEIDAQNTTTNGTGGAMVFQTRVSDALAERMRIDSSGNLLVNTTTTGQANTQGFAFNVGTGSYLSIGHATGTAGGQPFLSFSYNGGAIGSVTQNGTTAVAYNTSSDYRLKKNIAPITGALVKVNLLKPCTYTWKFAPDETGEGFIAHELAEICPQAVHGEKDAVDADGNPVYQGIDTSFLVATLTAAIQEQQALITALTARITALETK